jgi:putative sugar O-methyltransferase
MSQQNSYNYRPLVIYDGEIQYPAAISPIEGMMIESIEEAPKNESAIVLTLIASFTDAKKRQKDISGSHPPEADWERYLELHWSPYYQAINQKDLNVIAPFLRNFFRNEAISGFWGDDRIFESFVALDGIQRLERAHVMQRQFEAWRTALPKVPITELNAPRIGNPWGYIIEGKLLYEPVFEYHYQANYFANILCEISNPVILEIGGGFGGLAYQIVKHIPHVKYIGFDLPENILLQGYYLSCAFPGLEILTYSKNITVLTQDIISKYDIILLPDFMIREVESGIADLIVNVRSLSEMPVGTITEYFKQIDRLGRLYFFHENIFKNRLDGLYGIPSSEFPTLSNFLLIAESESRWPRYRQDSQYPCHEYIYIHRSRITDGGYRIAFLSQRNLAIKILHTLRRVSRYLSSSSDVMPCPFFKKIMKGKV